MKIKPLLFSFTVVAACIAPLHSIASELTEQLATCALVSNNAERLTCYDELASPSTTTYQPNDNQPSDNEATKSTTSESPKEALAEATAEAPAEALPDSIGGGEFADAAGKQEKSYVGRVTSCKKSADRRWFFIFENGQVWKQTDRRKRRFKECNFNVTISEDSFGYLMQIEGKKGKVRVDRRR